METELVKKIGNRSRETLAGAGKNREPVPGRWEPELVKEMYKNGPKEPGARRFLEGAGAESW